MYLYGGMYFVCCDSIGLNPGVMEIVPGRYVHCTMYSHCTYVHTVNKVSVSSAASEECCVGRCFSLFTVIYTGCGVSIVLQVSYCKVILNRSLCIATDSKSFEDLYLVWLSVHTVLIMAGSRKVC